MKDGLLPIHREKYGLGGHKTLGVAVAPVITGAGQQFFGGNMASESKPKPPGKPLLKGEPGTEVRAPLDAMLKPLISLFTSAV